MADDFADLVNDALGPARQAHPRLTLATASPVPGGVAGAGDGFLVDPERAQVCIDRLRVVAADLREALFDMRMTRFDPPTSDEVGRNLVRNNFLMAGRLERYVSSWADQIDAVANGLQEDLRNYLIADATTAQRLT